MWREAEALGFHSGWLFDHFMEPTRRGITYDPILEAWTTLSTLAAETKRLRLGVTVLCVAYRHPAVLAKMASTLDVISEGRVELGVGAGWARNEFKAYGFHFDRPAVRIAKLRETVIILKKMFTEARPTFNGTYYAIRHAINNPKPVQQQLPIWIGGTGEQHTLRVVAELADGWNFEGLTLDEYMRKLAVLDQHCAIVGRKITEIRKSLQTKLVVAPNDRAVKRIIGSMGVSSPRGIIAGTPDQCIDTIGEYIDHGVSLFLLNFIGSEPLRALRLFAKEVLHSIC
jgi:F420-dependent oxidoreductase-like protein